MEKGNTKEQILNAALDLFSVQGFEATSISQIANAVGVRKASLYSHFSSKQEILDLLIAQILEHHEKHSLFARADWNDPAFTATMTHFTEDDLVSQMLGQLRYVLHDPNMRKARKMLVIEQFRNVELAALMTKQNYTDIMQYTTGLMRFLIDRNILVDGDAELMAAQCSLPLSVWLNLCDREPEREPEVVALIERHVRRFFQLYQAK